ncbi:microcompartment protein PduM, partial [Escherichia coli]|nr:microcompartment protein PduM [Escherichia coli]
MNSELLAKIVDEVVARLQRRATSVAMLSVAQLREANQRT